MRAGVFPAEQARRRQRHAAAGRLLELAFGVEHLLAELSVQPAQAVGEGLQVVARAGMGIGGENGGGQGDGDQRGTQEDVHGGCHRWTEDGLSLPGRN